MIAAASRTAARVQAPHKQAVTIRAAEPDEAADVFRLISDNLASGHLLPRPLGEIVLHAPRFFVAAGPTGIVACAELARLGPTVAEIRSLVVSEAYRGRGIGRRLISTLLHSGRRQGYPAVCAFTHDPKPFVRLGFSIVPHPWVPEKISTDCYKCTWFRRCRQYAVVLTLGNTSQEMETS
jgi:amino-acid N-acetyltransferase